MILFCRYYAFHFGGAQRRTVIDLTASPRRKKAAEIKVNEWFLQLPGVATEKPFWLINVNPGHLEMELPSKIDSLEKSLGRPFANKKLPLEVRIDEVRGWLNIEEEVENRINAYQAGKIRSLTLEEVLSKYQR